LTEKTQNIILIALLIILLALQLYWIFRQKNLKRKYTKLIINVLLWLSFIVLIFPPKTKNNRNLAKVGISDGQISDQFLEKIKDSLALETVISTTKYEKEFQDKDIQIHLLGQKFTPEFLTQLAGKNVQFHPEFKKDEIQNLSWRGVLFQNETQEING
jgi:cbb3-type cytochrome oxidase subunit 3